MVIKLDGLGWVADDFHVDRGGRAERVAEVEGERGEGREGGNLRPET
jgi:hypothetical protein